LKFTPEQCHKFSFGLRGDNATTFLYASIAFLPAFFALLFALLHLMRQAESQLFFSHSVFCEFFSVFRNFLRVILIMNESMSFFVRRAAAIFGAFFEFRLRQ
jgi:hypothetical protein